MNSPATSQLLELLTGVMSDDFSVDDEDFEFTLLKRVFPVMHSLMCSMSGTEPTLKSYLEWLHKYRNALDSLIAESTPNITVLSGDNGAEKPADFPGESGNSTRN